MFKFFTGPAKMEQKETYTLRELFDNLEITFTELKKRSGISDVTLGRIRNGYSARRNSINILLRTFSELYGIKFSLKNVSGIIIQGKPVHEEHTSPANTPPMGEVTSTSKSAYKRPSRRKEFPEKELPEGCTLATDFARAHDVHPITFRDHILIGLGRGEKEKVVTNERPKPARPNEVERYLTPEQQRATLDFWKRHGIEYKLYEQEEKPGAEERPWWSADKEESTQAEE